MRVIVLCGVPGAGKTFLRQNDERLAGLPVADMSEVYEDVPGISWDAAVCALMVKAQRLLLEHGEVIVEGMFLPGTPSRKLLERELEGMQVDVEYILVHRPFGLCQRGIMVNSRSAYELKKRREILTAYWQKAGEIWRRR